MNRPKDCDKVKSGIEIRVSVLYGSRRADVEIKGVLRPRLKNGDKPTLFPEGWSDNQIMSELNEGLVAGGVVRAGGVMVVSPSGVKIQIYMKANGTIKTFYPIFEN
jgi:hypothetical protein